MLAEGNMNMNKKTNISTNVLIWFGAAVCIDEIVTGTYAADLGLKNGIFAILLGHLIGCFFLCFAAIIGAKTSKNAMSCVSLSFGNRGNIFFSIINVLQLFGWTIIMLLIGSNLISTNFPNIPLFFWIMLMSIVIIIWIIADGKYFDIINISAIVILFITILFISYKVLSSNNLLNNSMYFSNSTNYSGQNSDDYRTSFGSVLELSVAMPLSWIPLISDYVSKAKRPVLTSVLSSISYFIGSSWMYLLGLFATILMGVSNSEESVGKNIFGLLSNVWIIAVVIILSTVTTTFLDANSCGESIFAINKKWQKYRKLFSVIIVIFAAVASLVMSSDFFDSFQSFLYLIGAAFAPMIAIMVVDFFILKKNYLSKRLSAKNIIIWLIGFLGYQLAIYNELTTFLGVTVPCILMVSLLVLLVNKCESLYKRGKNKKI